MRWWLRSLGLGAGVGFAVGTDAYPVEPLF